MSSNVGGFSQHLDSERARPSTHESSMHSHVSSMGLRMAVPWER